jgi:hypothetical protein
LSDVKAVADWERVELDYRAGLLSTREIGAAHGLSHTAVNKRAKQHGWTRDLTAKIKAKADALVARAEVSSEVASQRAATELEVIEAGALRLAQVRGGHKTLGHKLITLGGSLLMEVMAQSADVEALAQLGELMRKPDDKCVDKLNDTYLKIISSAGRVDTSKKLSEMIKNGVAIECQAHGLAIVAETPPTPPDPSITNLTDAARRIAYLLTAGAPAKDPG